jgi:hypothetical protein
MLHGANFTPRELTRPLSWVLQTFGSELLTGLQYLHCNGVLFCDLKPANILIDEFGSLKVGCDRADRTAQTAPLK